jgi:hypothetical protein
LPGSCDAGLCVLQVHCRITLASMPDGLIPRDDLATREHLWHSVWEAIIREATLLAEEHGTLRREPAPGEIPSQVESERRC